MLSKASAAAMKGNTRALWQIGLGENNTDLATTLAQLLDMQPDMRCAGTAASCSAVLQVAQQLTIDAWLLDLALDDGSSLALIPEPRGIHPPAVIVVVTGLKSAQLTQQCLSAGADAVLAKDGQIQTLLTVLRDQLTQRHHPITAA